MAREQHTVFWQNTCRRSQKAGNGGAQPEVRSDELPRLLEILTDASHKITIQIWVLSRVLLFRGSSGTF